MKRFARIPLPALSLIAGLLLATAPAVAQTELLDAAPSGTEYYVGFMQNDDDAGGAVAKFMGVMITSQVATVGTVDIPGYGTTPFSTQPGQYTTISVPRVFEHRISEDTIGEAGKSVIAAIHISARAPISVFAMNARQQSTGGFVAIPVSSWGTRYLAVGLPNGFGGRTSELMIVAAYDDTYIQFTPSVKTVRQERGTVRQIKLDRGRTYFVQALAREAGVADLSASEIVSSRPVGLICGHVRTPVTIDATLPSDPQAYATHQAYMALPDSAWGYEFASMPMRAGGDRFRVMPSREASIIVTHHGPAGIGRDTLALDAGEVRDVFQVDGQMLTGGVEWHSSVPTMVLQLRTGGRYGDPAESPALVPLTALSTLASRSAFIAPERIGEGTFAQHRLSLLVSAPEELRNDPKAVFQAIRLDGVPIEVFAPGGEPTPIGTNGLFRATMSIRSGGHILVASEGVRFGGTVSGENGTIYRDAYLWALPTWGEPEQLDVSAPYVVSVQTPAKGTVDVTLSDITGGYFSGVGDIQTSPGVTGWVRTAFNAPMPNDLGLASFRAITDPSGPLNVTIRDRDGNVKDTMLSPSLCFKTARPVDARVEIRTNAGLTGSSTLELVANECGDVANVRSIVFGSGSVAVHLEARFDNGLSTTTIPSSGRATLTVTSASVVPQGRHEATMRISVDDSLLAIPVLVVVDPPLGVDDEHVAGSLLRVYPNPVTASATIALGRALGADGRLTISDNLGRTVRTIDATEAAGATELLWDGRDASGTPVAAGIYLVTLSDRGARSVTGLSVVR